MKRNRSGPGSQRRICCSLPLVGPYDLANDTYSSTAEKILNEYLASVGGKEQIMFDWEEKKKEARAKKGPKKRGRASTGTTQANGSAKRGRKGDHPSSATPPASVKDFKPPSGSWEEEVVGIDACEGTEGSVVVYLTWKNGHKTQHPLPQVYKRCPQKVGQNPDTRSIRVLISHRC